MASAAEATVNYPEVVPANHSTLEVASHNQLAAEKEVVLKGSPIGSYAPIPQQTDGMPWWRRRKPQWTAIVAFVIAVSLIIGLAAGLTRKKPSSTEGSPSPSPRAVSVCRSTVCPQVLSAAWYGNSPTSSLFVFGLGTDRSVWYRVLDGANGDDPKWTGDWTSLSGPFLSQRAAVSLTPTRLYVFGVTSSPAPQQQQQQQQNRVAFKIFANGTWSFSWADLGGNVTSPPAACNDGHGNIHVWLIEAATGVVAQKWINTTMADFTHWDLDSSYRRSGMQPSQSAPGAVCRPTDTYTDIVVYAKNNASAMHTQWNVSIPAWTDWVSLGGKFVGDPVVVEAGADRFHFFGIGTNKAMYHFSWTLGTGFSPMVSLGGGFESVPSAIVTGTTDHRIDVVALGTDDKLKHRALVGWGWSPDWEDLGLFANSAPLVVAGESGRIAMFAIGPQGELNHASWKASTDVSWKNVSQWASIGGNFTTLYPLKVL